MIMKILSTILLTLLIVLGACTSPQVSPDPFVRVSNGRLTVNGKPYYYIGTNFWYGAILGSQGQGGNRERLLRELDYLKALGINNLRVLVGADGKDGIPTKAEPALQVEAGVYNDTIFDGLDFFLSELDKRDMYAVLFLNNSWEWSGGYSQYLYWAGHGEVPMPNVAGWDAFSNYVAQYAKSEKAHHLFRDHITHVVNRVNRYTGKKYSEDPAIMSWQIGNEPRPFGEDNKKSFAAWIADCAALIKSMDSNHLVSIGSEGMAGCEGDLSLWTSIHADANVDYTTIHIWPNNWGWIDKKDIPGTIGQAIENTCSYIDMHVQEAFKINKPLVLEEFGLPRDSVKFTSNTSTVQRDRYYRAVFDIVEKHAAEKGVFQGCNFCAWGGFAEPQHLFWQRGDDYMGDPGQEEQGLNSVYATDSTINMIKEAVSDINQIIQKQ